MSKELTFPQLDNPFYKLTKTQAIKINLEDNYLRYREASIGQVLDEEVEQETWVDRRWFADTILVKDKIETIEVAWIMTTEKYLCSIYTTHQEINIPFESSEKALALQKTLINWLFNNGKEI